MRPEIFVSKKMQAAAESSNDLLADSLVLSLDFDGCTDTFEARQKLIQYVIDYCRANPQYKRVLVAIGSLRQSVFCDLNNAVINSRAFNGLLQTSAVLLSEFTENLAVALKANLGSSYKVVRVKMLTSDIYNDLPEGSSLGLFDTSAYKNIFQTPNFMYLPIYDIYGRRVDMFSNEQFNLWYKATINHLDEHEKNKYLAKFGVTIKQFNEYLQWRKDWKPFEMVANDSNGIPVSLLAVNYPGNYSPSTGFHFDDLTKCLTMYALCQYVYSKLQRPFTVLHFDDRVDLLQLMNNYFTKHKYLIPNRCSYRSVSWNANSEFAEDIENVFPTVPGNGVANIKYKEQTKEVAERCNTAGISPVDCMHLLLDKNEVASSAAQEQRLIPPKSPETADLKLFQPKPRRPVPMVYIGDDKLNMGGLP